MNALDFISTKLKAPELLVPGWKPAGPVGHDESHENLVYAKTAWLFSEGGGFVEDSLKGHQGTLNTGNSWINNKGELGLDCSGTNSFFDVPNVIDNWSEGTIIARAHTDSTSFGLEAVYEGGNTGTNRFYVGRLSGKWVVRLGSSDYVYGTNTVAGQIKTIAVAWDSTETKLYENGVEKASVGAPTGTVGTGDNDRIGALRNGSYRWDGGIYWILPFDGKLSADQIREIEKNPFAFLRPPGPRWLPRLAGPSYPAILLGSDGRLKEYTDESPNSPLILSGGRMTEVSDPGGNPSLIYKDGMIQELPSGATLLR